MEQLKPPKEIEFEAKSLPQEWKRWNEELLLYLDLAMAKTDESLKVKLFKYLIGKKGREIYATMHFDTEEKDRTIDELVKAFDAHCDPIKNETVERYKFFTRNQEHGESFEKYLTELKILANTCNFESLKDSLLRDRIICGIIDVNVRERLLRESSLDFEKCVQICRAAELSKSRSKELESTDTVHQLSKGSTTPKRTANQCKYCGKQHEMRKERCPAYGQTCRKCQKKNHWASQCHSATKEVKLVKKVESRDDEYEEIRSVRLTPSEIMHVNTLVESKYPKQLYATIEISGKPVKFQLDSGATCNVITAQHLNHIEDLSLTQTGQVLSMYNQSTIKPLGHCWIKMVNPKNGKRYKAEFVVVEAECMPLLGSRAIQQMELITVRHENILTVTKSCSASTERFSISNNPQASAKPSVKLHSVEKRRLITREVLLQEYSDVFEGTGLIAGEYHIDVDSSVKPVVHPPRKFPVSMRAELERELERLTEMGVLAPVTSPTPWVSSMVVVRKPNGKLRVCLDPRDLNHAIRRSHYPVPTIEQILPELTNAKVFSTVDVKNGFWHVALDEDSSYLTTFNTPYGRYRWLRMPFGISSAPEVFQRKQHEAVEGLSGVKCIHDDILIFGEGSTVEEATWDHDCKLRALMERCRERNIKLNEAKVKLRMTSVPFIGHQITSEGLKPDPNKIKAVVEMPSPTDVKGVQRFLGFVNYLSKFLPQLSDVCEPLRKLTVKGVEWCWLETHDQVVEKVKQLVTTTPILKYYNPKEELTLQCDASETGLGAALLQNGQPVAYASRALTETETHYAQIEKELLSVMFGLEKFHQYTYGRPVTVHSDHKPLEVIVTKPLHRAPKRLQRMLLRLQSYDYTLVYRKGKMMELADTLSRAYVSDDRDIGSYEIEQVNMVDYLPISESLIRDIQRHTETDKSLQVLKHTIVSGWPESKSEIHLLITPYFHFRDELSVQHGVIFKGERAVIPKELRRDMMKRIHSSHIGVEGCLRRARESIYWPGMNAEVKDFIEQCEVCRSCDDRQQKETLLPHDVPDRPWAKVGVDLFLCHDNNYLITVDYYSNYWEVDYLEDTKARTIIRKLKSQFARFGIPDICMSDNGPQFSSEEFAQFSKAWEFKHITSSPSFPQSNGKVERAVKTAKGLMQKAKKAGSDPYLALLDFRNTPTQVIGSSPVQLLMSRRTKTLLSTSCELLKPKVEDSVADKIRVSKEKQAYYYNQGAKDLPALIKGDVVRVAPSGNWKEWRKAEVTKQRDSRSYEVITETGQVLRRNRRDLRRTKEEPLKKMNFEDIEIEIESTNQPLQTSVQNGEQQENEPVKAQPHVEEQSFVMPTAGSAPEPVQTTRRGRVVRKPAYLKDFET